MSSMTAVSGIYEHSRIGILFQAFREWNKNGTKDSGKLQLFEAPVRRSITAMSA